MSHTFIAHSALGDQLQFRSMTGSEEMGKLFEFRVVMLSQSDGISADSLLGTDLTVEVDLTTEADGAGKRYLSGQVAGFAFTGREGDFFSYEAQLRPWLWLATRRTDFKIFQNKTVPDIVQEVLAPYGFTVDNKLTGNYRTWEYCVQYGETDFNFISRLLQHEGGYFYFRHKNGSHDLVLADGIGSHSPLPNGPTTIPYYPKTRAADVHDEDYIDTFRSLQDITSGRYATDDYDFTKPRALLDTKQAQPGGYSQDNWEVYNWPGGYTDTGDGENYARVRMEQIEAKHEVERGSGKARNMAPGYIFTFSKYPSSQYNQSYLIDSATYEFTENVQRSDGGGADSPTNYRIGFTAVPVSVRYRVRTHTTKPRTHGPQTATVVGPAGEEIYTNQYGQIKVQFHWDRYGTNDENSSCWIRVSQTWAGANYGTMHIPRIGQEVIVDFLNGDPDYPIVTGRVYNAMQMPPWDLPANKTQSGIKTRSSKDGTPGDGMKNSPGMANAIRFEDKAGAEQLWLHAQKDQLTEVENDESKWVGNDRDKTIDGNETSIIHKNRKETVDLDETITIHGNRTETVDLNEGITIHQNRSKTVDLNEQTAIGQNQTHSVGIDRSRTVGADETVGIGVNQDLTVGVDRTKTVGVNESDKIGSMWSIDVGMMETENIGLASMQNVGVVKVESTGVAHIETVGVAQVVTIGFDQITTVGMDRTVTVGQDQTTTIGQKHTVEVGKTLKHTVGVKATYEVGQWQSTTVSGTYVVEAAERIELKCGAATLVLTSDGFIYLNGQQCHIKFGTLIAEDAGTIDLNTGSSKAPPPRPNPPADDAVSSSSNSPLVKS